MGRDDSYDSFKKNKSNSLKELRHNFEFAFLKGLLAYNNIGSIKRSQRLGSRFGRLAYRLAAKDKAIARYQLEFCYPELRADEREQIVKDCFENMGKTLFETLNIQKFRHDPHQWITIHNAKIVTESLQQGKGAIFVFGHLGNWELLSIVYEMLDIKGITVESPVGVPKLDHILQTTRRSNNISTIPRGDKNAAKSILKCFRHNQIFLFAIDQDMKVQRVFTDFFGRPASTAVGCATMAQTFGVPVISVFGARSETGTHDYFFELLSSAPYEKGAEEALRLTQIYTTAVERQVRKYPGQWVWFHRRWKTQPD